MYVDYSQCRIVDVMVTQMFAFEWVLMPVEVTCTRLGLASKLSVGFGLLSFATAIFRKMSLYLFLWKASIFFVGGRSHCIPLSE